MLLASSAGASPKGRCHIGSEDRAADGRGVVGDSPVRTGNGLMSIDGGREQLTWDRWQLTAM